MSDRMCEYTVKSPNYRGVGEKINTRLIFVNKINITFAQAMALKKPKLVC